MYIVEIIDQRQNWIAAAYEDERKGEAFVERIKEANLQFEIHQLTIQFPLYIIETIDVKEGSELNKFIFTGYEGYVTSVRHQKQNLFKDDFETYFTVFLLEEEYFQESLEGSNMGAIDHVHLDNYFLKSEEAEKGPLFNRIQRFSSNWDFYGLDKIFEKYIKSGTQEEKEELAYDGYLSLFSQMHYDFTCGKLTEEGVALLFHNIEKAELLLNKKLWEARADAHIIHLEHAIKNEKDGILTHFKAAEESLLKLLEAEPEKEQECYKQLAYIYDTVAEIQVDGLNFWKTALSFITKSVHLASLEADWFLYLTIVYLPYEVRKNRKVLLHNSDQPAALPEWSKLRNEAKESLKAYTFSIENSDSKVPYKLALAIEGFKDHLQWAGVDVNLISEDDYLYWLEQAKGWIPVGPTRMEVMEAGNFFHKEGKRLRRIDLIKTAIGHYQMLVDKLEDAVFEVFYLGSALEDIAMIYGENSEKRRAEEFLNKASEFYRNHFNIVRSNPSVLMHYTEFLERIYLYDGNIEKPPIDRLSELAIITEDEGKGMYSTPTMLRIRLALLKQDEEEAIFHVKRMLLMHELCVADCIKELRESRNASSFQRFLDLLDETGEFMEEVAEDFYLDVNISWEDLKKLSFQEVEKAWEDRKAEIRNRKEI